MLLIWRLISSFERNIYSSRFKLVSIGPYIMFSSIYARVHVHKDKREVDEKKCALVTVVLSIREVRT